VPWKLIYDPGPNGSHSVLESISKNKKISEMLEGQIRQFLEQQDWINPTTKDGEVKAVFGQDFIQITVEPSKSKAPLVKSLTTADFLNEQKAENYFFGDPVVLSGEAKEVKSTIKEIIDEVMLSEIVKASPV
jgi:hypothetical protein